MPYGAHTTESSNTLRSPVLRRHRADAYKRAPHTAFHSAVKTRRLTSCLATSIPIMVCDIDGGLEMLPRSVAGNGAICRQDKALGRRRQHTLHGLSDVLQAPRGDHTFPLQAAHEWSTEHLGDVCWAYDPLAERQAAVDYMARIVQERGQIVIAARIVTDV